MAIKVAGTVVISDGRVISNLASALSAGNGGTGNTATPSAGSIAFGDGTGLAYTAVGTSGQYLKSSGSGVPVWGDVTATTVDYGCVSGANTLNLATGTKFRTMVTADTTFCITNDSSVDNFEVSILNPNYSVSFACGIQYSPSFTMSKGGRSVLCFKKENSVWTMESCNVSYAKAFPCIISSSCTATATTVAPRANYGHGPGTPGYTVSTCGPHMPPAGTTSTSPVRTRFCNDQNDGSADGYELWINHPSHYCQASYSGKYFMLCTVCGGSLSYNCVYFCSGTCRCCCVVANTCLAAVVIASDGAQRKLVYTVGTDCKSCCYQHYCCNGDTSAESSCLYQINRRPLWPDDEGKMYFEEWCRWKSAASGCGALTCWTPFGSPGGAICYRLFYGSVVPNFPSYSMGTTQACQIISTTDQQCGGSLHFKRWLNKCYFMMGSGLCTLLIKNTGNTANPTFVTCSVSSARAIEHISGDNSYYLVANYTCHTAICHAIQHDVGIMCCTAMATQNTVLSSVTVTGQVNGPTPFNCSVRLGAGGAMTCDACYFFTGTTMFNRGCDTTAINPAGISVYCRCAGSCNFCTTPTTFSSDGICCYWHSCQATLQLNCSECYTCGTSAGWLSGANFCCCACGYSTGICFNGTCWVLGSVNCTPSPTSSPCCNFISWATYRSCYGTCSNGPYWGGLDCHRISCFYSGGENYSIGVSRPTTSNTDVVTTTFFNGTCWCETTW